MVVLFNSTWIWRFIKTLDKDNFEDFLTLSVRNRPSVCFGTNVPCITFTVDNENITTERDVSVILSFSKSKSI